MFINCLQIRYKKLIENYCKRSCVMVLLSHRRAADHNLAAGGKVKKMTAYEAHLKDGTIYKNKNGGSYKCLWTTYRDSVLINTSTGWLFTAHNVIMYDDGTIEWDYSTGGRFVEVGDRNE